MSESKQREWHVTDDCKVWEATPEGPRVICTCEDLDDDAALIVAAPDLLAACEALPLEAAAFDSAADFVDHAKSFRNAMDLAQAAIRKATGGDA